MEKFTNYILLNGKKRQSQNCLLKIVRNLQKWSNKNVRGLLKLSFVLLVQFFKINNRLIKNKQKKVTSLVLHKNKSRTFLVLKSLVQTIKTGKSVRFFKKLYKEIKSVLEKKSFIIQTKKSIQNEVVSKKHLFFYFR
jgi:ribosomal protein S7